MVETGLMQPVRLIVKTTYFYLDGLGGDVDELYTGNPFKSNYASYLYKGQSLSRRSWAWPTSSSTSHALQLAYHLAYNWREANPSPGQDNIDPSNLPNLIVTQSPSDNKVISSSVVTITAALKPLPITSGYVLVPNFT